MMVSHWIVLPILIPAIIAAVIVLLGRFDIFLSRVFSVLSSFSLVVVSSVLIYMSSSGEVHVYSMGDWAAPFGIVLVLDRLSALMVGLTAIVGFGVLLYSIQDRGLPDRNLDSDKSISHPKFTSWDLKGKHFHSLFQFQLMGINGAFLTGDLFNLFVFFEVLLIASYGLMVHGGGVDRVRAGVQYVIINLIGSSFFLIAAGLIYSVTGTLNMADLAVKASQVLPGDMAILNTGAILLLLVFGIKSAAFPLHFWLPATYSNAPAPVAALFALLTKVGAYCILRVYFMIFPDLVSDWVLFSALLTLTIGALGVLAAKTFGQLVSYYMISSMGTLLIAIGQFTQPSIEAGLYYLFHSTFIGAILFLIVDLVRNHRGALTDRLQSGPPFNRIGLLSLVFLIASIAAIGLPPLSGFIGKIMILKSSFENPLGYWIWALILVSSLVTLIGFAWAGSEVFWKSTSNPVNPEEETDNQTPKVSLTSLGFLFSAVLALTLFADPASRYFSQVAAQLSDTQIYIDAVLGETENQTEVNP
jgi:multicomponent K+:H+ antiporter subunit D